MMHKINIDIIQKLNNTKKEYFWQSHRYPNPMEPLILSHNFTLSVYANDGPDYVHCSYLNVRISLQYLFNIQVMYEYLEQYLESWFIGRIVCFVSNIPTWRKVATSCAFQPPNSALKEFQRSNSNAILCQLASNSLSLFFFVFGVFNASHYVRFFYISIFQLMITNPLRMSQNFLIAGRHEYYAIPPWFW